ncbi:DUF2470 domain-containing protein [Siccirubricoccus deserti]
MFTGPAEGANPQTAPRVTLTGLATPVPAEEVPALKPRWLAKHPYAALYADFADFTLWQVAPGGALLVGGFARATRLTLAELLPDPAAVAAIAVAEAGILSHVNTDHLDALAAIATGLLGAAAGEWRMVAVDVDGADLAAGRRCCGCPSPRRPPRPRRSGPNWSPRPGLPGPGTGRPRPGDGAVPRPRVDPTRRGADWPPKPLIRCPEHQCRHNRRLPSLSDAGGVSDDCAHNCPRRHWCRDQQYRACQPHGCEPL